MTKRHCTVKLTARFEANLAAVERFLGRMGRRPAFERLLADIADRVLPNLERWPEMGRVFSDRPPDSVEARDRHERIRMRYGAPELREYVAGDFLILYARRDRVVFLLAVKHHQQLVYAIDEPGM